MKLKTSFSVELNPHIAEATSSEPREDFICEADLFHTQGGFNCKCLLAFALFPLNIECTETYLKVLVFNDNRNSLYANYLYYPYYQRFLLSKPAVSKLYALLIQFASAVWAERCFCCKFIPALRAEFCLLFSRICGSF